MSSADFTIYITGIGTLSYTVSPFLYWEDSAFVHFAAAVANEYNLVFSFQQILAEDLCTWLEK